MRETKTIDGVEHYQLSIADEWVESHPVPELEEGMAFFHHHYPSPCILVRKNSKENIEQRQLWIPGGVPDPDYEPFWLVYIPSSGSEPIRWEGEDSIKERFQTGLYSTDVEDRVNTDYSDAWWQPIVDNNMTEYNFIDTDLPEKRAEQNDSQLPEEDMETLRETDSLPNEEMRYEITGIVNNPNRGISASPTKSVYLGEYVAPEPIMAAEQADNDDGNINCLEYIVERTGERTHVNGDTLEVIYSSDVYVNDDDDGSHDDVDTDKVEGESTPGFLTKFALQVQKAML